MREKKGQRTLSRILLAAGAAVLALSYWAEAAGYGIVCSRPGDLTALAGTYAVMLACLVAAHLTRKKALSALPLALLAAASAFYLFYFPVASYASAILVVALVLPLALCLPEPLDLPLALLAAPLAAFFRFVLFPPAAFLKREAALMDVAAFVLTGLVAGGATALLSRLARRLDAADDALADVSRINLSYLDYRSAEAERFREEERRRLSRDVHDTVGYALTNVKMMLEAARIMADREPAKVGPFLDSAREQTEGAILQVRKDLACLRGGLDPGSGLEEVERSAAVFRLTTGMKIEIDSGGGGWSLDGPRAHALRHFAQEAMLNAFRHGRARRLKLIFRLSGGTLSVTASDDGRGASTVVEGIGLAGMRERAESFGGSLEYRSLPRGFSVTLRIPGAAE